MRELSTLFNHQFLCPLLLVSTLSHKLYPSDLNYKRLEFLGDTIHYGILLEDEEQMSQEKSKRTSCQSGCERELAKVCHHENLPLQMGIASVVDTNLDRGEDYLIDDFLS